MSNHETLMKCRGGFGTITLCPDRMIIDEASWRIAKSYELPIMRVQSVIVERRSVIPFVTIMILSAAVTVILKYNAFWFLVNLNPRIENSASIVGISVTVISAIPAILRSVFVNVQVTWDGDPSHFRLRLVPSRVGRRLANRFQELSEGS
jgi:hypothetical protein